MELNEGEGPTRDRRSPLARELKKRDPFESPEQEAVLSLARVSDRIGLRFARLFREHGLTPSQYNVLRILRGEGRPLPILEIAERMVAVVPGITGLIDRLERAGLVARARCPVDRRVVRVAIAPPAIERLNRLDAPVAALHREVVAGLDREELATLIALLEKLRANLADDGEARDETDVRAADDA